MRRLTISIDDDLAETFERLMKEKGYENRSTCYAGRWSTTASGTGMPRAVSAC
jgi:hypothetical protein